MIWEKQLVFLEMNKIGQFPGCLNASFTKNINIGKIFFAFLVHCLVSFLRFHEKEGLYHRDGGSGGGGLRPLDLKTCRHPWIMGARLINTEPL